MKKYYPIFGILAPLFYCAAVIIGGFSINGYDHIYNTISELTASDAPSLPLVQFLFFLYNFSIILFGFGLYQGLKKVKVAAICIILIGISGMDMFFFPQDPRHMEMTNSGVVHIVLASICSLLTMACLVLFAKSFHKDSSMRRLVIYTFLTFIFLFITGGIAAASVANDSQMGGLFERLTIGSYLQWIFVISLNLHILNKKTQSEKKGFY